MAKRVLTYFNTAIPPFKEEKYTSSATTIRFVISGAIPSKKNNQQAVSIRQVARNWANSKKKENGCPTWEDVHHAISLCSSKMRGNEKYKEFIKEQKPELQKQMLEWSNRLKDKGLVFPLTKATMTLKLYFKSKYIIDTVNKQQTIQDLLVDAGVIANDDYNTLNPIISKSACYYEEIIEDIASVSITTFLQQ
jgi:hypothetical protein